MAAASSKPSSSGLASVSTNPSTAPSLDMKSSGVQFTPGIPFTAAAVKKLFDEINRTDGDALIVYGVSVQLLTEIKKERSKRGRRLRFRFEAGSGMLIVTIPTDLHEELHLGLYNLALWGSTSNIVRMGRGHDWSTMGTKTLRAHGHLNGDEGEGESTGGPLPQRQHRDAWPTLIIEAGYSQSLEALRSNMRWWFGASDHQVKIVLLAKFDTQQMAVVVEKWVEIQASARQGATTTRAAAQLRHDCDQIITITQNPGTNGDNPTSYTVTRGALRLEFDLLFLREPQPGSAEGDVIIDIPDLQRWAVRLWQLVP